MPLPGYFQSILPYVRVKQLKEELNVQASSGAAAAAHPVRGSPPLRSSNKSTRGCTRR